MKIRKSLMLAGMLGAGFVTAPSSAQVYVCMACPAGTYSDGNNTNCAPCPAGTYCHAGVAAPTQCTAGNYCPNGKDQVGCPVGSYCPANSKAPTPCSAGTYQPNIMQAACIACGDSKYNTFRFGFSTNIHQHMIKEVISHDSLSFTDKSKNVVTHVHVGSSLFINEFLIGQPPYNPKNCIFSRLPNKYNNAGTDTITLTCNQITGKVTICGNLGCCTY